MNRKVKIGIVVLTTMIAATVSFILYNSFLNGKKSYVHSDKVISTVQTVITSTKKVEKETMIEWVRKSAHVLEFSALGGEMMGLLLLVADSFRCHWAAHLSLPLLGVLMTGVVDEFIQSFHGRTSCVSDVLIDFGGGALGMLLLLAVYVFVQLVRRKKRLKGGGNHE